MPVPVNSSSCVSIHTAHAPERCVSIHTSDVSEACVSIHKRGGGAVGASAVSWRIVRGDADDVELAALCMALSAVAKAAVAGTEAARTRVVGAAAVRTRVAGAAAVGTGVATAA
ncbi:MAG TPA: hypothetical protein VJ914_24670, partial [Pseudonocardiaceae bacterium]|nr:hypothetical protein [Pseudonocardiaceae bacterium]